MYELFCNKMQKCNLIAAILAVFVSSEHHINFMHLVTFEGLADDSGTTESCVYDPINGLWRFFDRYMNGEADSLPSTYPFFPSNGGFMQGREGAGNETSSGVAGQAFVQTDEGNFLYIADFQSGQIFKYNVDTEQLEEELDTGKPGANGLCYDKKRNMLYATNIGIDFVTSTILPDTSNIVRFNLDDVVPSAETIYFSGDPLINQFGNTAEETVSSVIDVTGEDYVFRPNGCTVKDDMVYFVETRLDLTGHLLIYNIEQDSLLLNSEILVLSGDGMVVSHFYNVHQKNKIVHKKCFFTK